MNEADRLTLLRIRSAPCAVISASSTTRGIRTSSDICNVLSHTNLNAIVAAPDALVKGDLEL